MSIVRDAVKAMAGLEPDEAHVRQVLAMWSRYPEMTDDERERVVAYFTGQAPVAVLADHVSETFGNVTTVVVSPRVQVRVTADVGRTGLTGLTVETGAGDSVTVALPPPCVDALLEALAAATPVSYVPQLLEVHVFTAASTPVGDGSKPAAGGGGR